MSISLRSALLVVSLMLLAAPGAAQDLKPANPDDDWGWFAVGIGPMMESVGQDVGFFTASANVGRRHVVQLGASFQGPFVDEYNAVNLSYGYSVPMPVTRIAAFIGPAIVWGDIDTTIGAEASVQLHLTPVREVGLGVELAGQLTPEGSRAGLAFLFVFEANK